MSVKQVNSIKDPARVGEGMTGHQGGVSVFMSSLNSVYPSCEFQLKGHNKICPKKLVWNFPKVLCIFPIKFPFGKFCIP